VEAHCQPDAVGNNRFGERWGYARLIPGRFKPTMAKADARHHRSGQQGSAAQFGGLGALRAWAWGASRALDYFETDKSVDAKRVGLEGHSRYGKATVVAMRMTAFRYRLRQLLR